MASEEPAFAVILAGILVALVCFPFLFPVGLGILKGQMGYLKHRESIVYAVDQLTGMDELFYERLKHENFRVTKLIEDDGTLRIEAKRDAKMSLLLARENPFHAFKHADKPMHAEIVCAKMPEGVSADLLLRYNEFILADSGEIQYQRALAFRLLNDDLSSAPPAVANPSAMLINGFGISAAAFAGSLSALVPWMPFPSVLAAAIGMLSCASVAVPLLAIGAVPAMRHRKEISGLRFVVPALALMFSAIALPVGVLVLRYPNELMAEWIQLQDKHDVAPGAAIESLSPPDQQL